ncbi:MAG: hypothetical protein KKD92_01875, partial [Proteobacteria bacterium]|nr:hypothetical protein [Pseudomonadota bacterium]
LGAKMKSTAAPNYRGAWGNHADTIKDRQTGSVASYYFYYHGAEVWNVLIRNYQRSTAWADYCG